MWGGGQSGTSTEQYLQILRQTIAVGVCWILLSGFLRLLLSAMDVSLVGLFLQEVRLEFKPQLLIYNAGTDILEGDPLGNLQVALQIFFLSVIMFFYSCFFFLLIIFFFAGFFLVRFPRRELWRETKLFFRLRGKSAAPFSCSLPVQNHSIYFSTFFLLSNFEQP